MAFGQLHMNLDDAVKRLLSSLQASTRRAPKTRLPQRDYVFVVTMDSKEQITDIIFVDGFGAAAVNIEFYSVSGRYPSKTWQWYKRSLIILKPRHLWTYFRNGFDMMWSVVVSNTVLWFCIYNRSEEGSACRWWC